MNLIEMPGRREQLWWLIILSALTMIFPYSIQGTLAAGRAPEMIPEWVWVADHAAWAIRALVEGLVIGYLARTRTSDSRQNILLWVMKVSLVALITLTLGPAMYATLNGVPMARALPPILQWLWALGLASYMPLMVLASSYAYKVQPVDDEPLAQAPAKPKRQRKRKSGVNKDEVREFMAQQPEPSAVTGGDIGEQFGVSASRGRQLRAELLPEINANGKGSDD